MIGAYILWKIFNSEQIERVRVESHKIHCKGKGKCKSPIIIIEE